MMENSPIAEVQALQRVVEAIEGLDDDAVHRIIHWLTDRYGQQGDSGTPRRPAGAPRDATAPNGQSSQSSTSQRALAEFFATANPRRDPDRALVVAYWLQEREGRRDLDAQGINGRLKQLGHGVSNITRALAALGQQSPKLLIQTGKRGSARQGRKRYAVTAAGIEAIETRPGILDYLQRNAGDASSFSSEPE